MNRTESIIALCLLALLVLAVAGCGHRPPKIVTQEVRVEVPVRCVDPADIPPVRDMEHETLVRADTIFRKTQALLIDVKGLQSDTDELRALLRGCLIDAP